MEPLKQKQISREFFKGHLHQIVFMCHIENGKDMVSIDEQGHLFIWKYDKRFMNATGQIEPAYKYRIPLNYVWLERVDNQEDKGKPLPFETAKYQAIDQRQQVSTDGMYKFIL